MTKEIGLFLLLSALAGCSTSSVYKPVTIEVPVAVPCQTPVISHPVWPTEDLTDKSTLFEQVRALLAERELRQSYETKMEAAVSACR